VLRRIAKDSVVLFGGEAVSRLLLFATSVALARALGPESFGLVTFAQALLGYFLILGDAGLATYGVRAVAASPQSARGAWLGIVRTRTAITLVLVVAAWIVLLALRLDRTMTWVVGITLTTAIPAAVLADWALRGLGRMHAAAGLLVLSSAVTLALVLGLVSGPADVVWAPGARVVGALAAALAGLWLLRGFPFAGAGAREASAWLSIHGVSRMLASGGALLATNAAVLAYNSADMLLLEPLAGSREVGLYGSAYRVIQLPMAGLYTLTAAALPALVRSRAGAPVSRQPLRLLQVLALIAGLVIALALWGLREPIVRMLYGPAYREAARALAVLAFAVPLDFLVSVKGTGYIAAGLERTAALCAGAAALVNVAGNLVLIPRWGMMGAAWTTLGTYLLLLALYTAFLDRKSE
jgi:O-antigen/teichoic acid export membrane protein